MPYARAAVASFVALLVAGCFPLIPATYIVSPDVRQALKANEGSRLRLAEVTDPAHFDPMCRAAGHLTFENGLTVSQFVQKAFNDEFRYAGIYAPDGVALKGRLTRAAFSSSAAVVNGWWDLALTLESPAGRTLAVEVRHEFSAGFNAHTACSSTAKALGQAAQALVRKAVEDPLFATLVR